MESNTGDAGDYSGDDRTGGDESLLTRQMQTIMQLMGDRVAGRASSEAVEAAVQTLLRDAGVAPSTHQAAGVPLASLGAPGIEQDIEEYDDIDELPPYDATSPAREDVSHVAIASAPPINPSVPVKRKRGRPRKSDAMAGTSASTAASMDWSAYADIPLGKQGAQMLITFGDGPKPRPPTVAACLLGARRMLQVAVQDARYLRRKQSQAFHAARRIVKPQDRRKRPVSSSPTPATAEAPAAADSQALVSQDELTPSILYRAIVGFDRLSGDPPCGFDEEELRLLYPEEMNAYRLWINMHDEYAKKTKDSVPGDETEDATNVAAENDETTNQTSAEGNSLNPPAPVTDAGGHLAERLAQFDIRTNRMKDDWYLQFADLRQGSFLPRDLATKTAQNKAWQEYRREFQGSRRGRNANSDVSWADIGFVPARFLHWVGFDMEHLPPPNHETTMALGFLAYDFFGRIVEKAIFLRNAEKSKDRKRRLDETKVLLELPPGDQLEESDIQRALDDINPIPLYSAISEKKIEPQLYFGPGFEDRLEMEMEELLAGIKEKPVSEEEVESRRVEDAMFAKMAEPPAKNGVASLLEDLVDDSERGCETKRQKQKNAKNK